MQAPELRYYRIGGLKIAIDGPGFPDTEALAPFRAAPLLPDLRMQVILCDPFPPLEGEVSGGWIAAGKGSRMLVDGETRRPVAIVSEEEAGLLSLRFDATRPERYGGNFLLQALDLPHRMPALGGVFLHASYIAYREEAILFTAPKQTGKSTQASLWERYRGAEIVNGDRALLRRENGRWLACGSPYCGSSKICLDCSLPIRAIVILSQSAENSVRRATVTEAFAALLSGCSYDPTDKAEVERVAGIAAELISTLPFYCLACTPDERAVEALETLL